MEMKKLVTILLVLTMVLSLAACGGEQAPSVDLAAVYESCQKKMPEMMLLEGDTRLDFLGVRQEDCSQVITAIASDGLLTDEIWLIEAVDDKAAETVSQLMDSRLQAKADETVSYAPEQYAVVEKAQVIRQGRYLVLLVTEQAESIRGDVEAALGGN